MESVFNTKATLKKMCMGLPECVCMYVPHVHGTCIGQKRVSDPQELELWIVVSHCVSIGDQTGVLWRSVISLAAVAWVSILYSFMFIIYTITETLPGRFCLLYSCGP